MERNGTEENADLSRSGDLVSRHAPTPYTLPMFYLELCTESREYPTAFKKMYFYLFGDVLHAWILQTKIDDKNNSCGLQTCSAAKSFPWNLLITV